MATLAAHPNRHDQYDCTARCLVLPVQSLLLDHSMCCGQVGGSTLGPPTKPKALPPSTMYHSHAGSRGPIIACTSHLQRLRP